MSPPSDPAYSMAWKTYRAARVSPPLPVGRDPRINGTADVDRAPPRAALLPEEDVVTAGELFRRAH